MTQTDLKKLLSEMTLQEKIEQLVQLHGGFFGAVDTYTGPVVDFKMTKNQPYRTGSVLGEHGAEHLRKLQDGFMALQPHHIPALFMADVIHGYKTAFPAPIALGSSFDPELVREVASAAAEEAASAGVHVTFSPMADLSRDARWGRCMESTGEDPYLNSEMVSAMVKGFQGDDISKRGKVASCVKHFAAYSAAVAGRDYNAVELSERTLRDDYLKAYKAAVDAGVKMVMTAFNTLDRIPCSTNKKLMRDILRDEMGFDGVLISDYGAIGETIAHGSSEDSRDAAKQAITAGVDIDMMSDCYLNYLGGLVSDGEISEKLIDEAVLRILALKNELGLFENQYKDGSPEYEREVIFCEKHKALSRKAAEETTVLLKNDGILPLLERAKIVVMGSLSTDIRITGSWAIFADTSKTVTLKAAMSELYPEADITFFETDEPTEEALACAKTADAVILAIGEDHTKTGEATSIAHIEINPAHQRLFDSVYTINKNIVSILFGGRPLAVPEISKKTAALIEAWLPGSLGCYAIADILFGKVNPSGRLSMSLPHCTGQLPVSYSQFPTGRPKPEMDGFCPYVSNYMDVPNTALYPFGYGLSYGSVDYSGVELDKYELSCGDKLSASVTVKNTGDIPFTETVQLYIRDIKGSVVRPMRELKGFKRVTLDSGEEKRVSFDITEEMLRFCDAGMNYTSEAGKFTLFIGHDSTTKNEAWFELKK